MNLNLDLFVRKIKQGIKYLIKKIESIIDKLLLIKKKITCKIVGHDWGGFESKLIYDSDIEKYGYMNKMTCKRCGRVFTDIQFVSNHKDPEGSE